MTIFHKFGMIIMVMGDSKDNIFQLMNNFFEFKDQPWLLEYFKKNQCNGDAQIHEFIISITSFDSHCPHSLTLPLMHHGLLFS